MKKSRNIKIGIGIIVLLLVVVTFRVSYSFKNKEAEIYINNEDYYIDDNLIKPIKLNTPKAEFVNSFKATANTLKLDCDNGTDYVGTNCVLKTVNSNESISEYKTVVYGDLNGDGKGTITDIAKIIEEYDKSDAELAAGDIDYNEKVDKNDAVLLAKNIILNEEILLPKSEEVPTKIELSQEKIVIARGESQKIIATTNKGNTSILSWQSKNPLVVEVDETGEVRGVGEGKTKIEVTATDGTKREIDVEGYVALTGISLNKKSTNLIINNINKKSETLVVAKTPSDATVQVNVVKWESNNENAVRVDANGQISAVGNGHATITAKITDIYNNKTYSDTSEVNVATQGEQVIINKSLLELNTTTKTTEILTAEVLPNETSNKEVTWSVVSGNAITIDATTGLVTVRQAGEATIRATAKDGSGVYGECSVKVYVLVNGITLTNNNIKLNTTTKTSETIAAIINPSNATAQNVVWSSDNVGIATVENGKITATGVGSTVIKATITDPYNGNYVHTATCNVNVSVLTTGISLNNNKMVMVPNEKRNLIATVTPTNATNKNVTWQSNNLGVATVNNGVVTAVGKGNTTITATTNDGYQTSCDITVDNDVYDVILFWGQSNMVGYAGSYKTSSCDVASPGENCLDYRIAENGGNSNFSSLTGINSNIIKNYSAVNHVNVPITSGTVYDYHSCSDVSNTICDDGKGHKGKGTLVEITSSTERIGQNLYPKPENNTVNFYSGVSTKNDANYYSLMRSYGTNMIPWYSYQHYKNTGHKVVAVLSANGGEILNHFLPHGSQNGCEDGICTSTNNQYLYEAMVAKYDAAIEYLKDQNMTIGNKFHILFQGENDAKRVDGGVNTMDDNNNCTGSNGNYWRIYYEFIHNKLKSEHDLNFGVIIETAWTLDSATYCGVERVHNAQQNSILNNLDVILGSSYSYNRYLPTQTLFSKYFNATYSKGLYSSYQNNFNGALEIAKLSQSVSKYKSTENMIHFNSAALSQIGLETANNVNYYLQNGVEK